MRYYILVGAVVAVMAAWSGFWFYASGQARTEIERRASESTPSRAWAYQDLDISGFPFRIQADLTQSRLDLRGGSGGLSWETDQIKAVGHPWQPRHVLLDLSSPPVHGATKGQAAQADLEQQQGPGQPGDRP